MVSPAGFEPATTGIRRPILRSLRRLPYALQSLYLAFRTPGIWVALSLLDRTYWITWSLISGICGQLRVGSHAVWPIFDGFFSNWLSSVEGSIGTLDGS